MDEMQAVREKKPFYWAVLGGLVLVGYGFLPTAQPTSNFGRIYAGALLDHSDAVTFTHVQAHIPETCEACVIHC